MLLYYVIPKKLCWINQRWIKKTSLGIDLGLSHLAITSKGDKIENPRYLRKLERKLKYYQRRYSKFKGKKNLRKVRRLHEKSSESTKRPLT